MIVINYDRGFAKISHLQLSEIEPVLKALLLLRSDQPERNEIRPTSAADNLNTAGIHVASTGRETTLIIS